MGLVGYEMYTHLQSLTGMHPATRHPITNSLLEKLIPWQDRRFCEPGTKVVGCLACQLGKLYQDSPAMEALSVVAKSGRRGGKHGIVQLVDEGWMGSWRGKGSWGVNEARADRRVARKGEDKGINSEWRGSLSLRGKGQVEWKEKKGFILSHAESKVGRPAKTQQRSDRPAKMQRHSGQNERHSPSPRRSVRSSRAGTPAQSQHAPEQKDQPAPYRRQSVQVDDRRVYNPSPQRPNRPDGLTLSIYGKQHEDRVQWPPRDDGRTIKRKPVPISHNDVDEKERGRKTLSTATTVVGSPQNRRSTPVRHSHQPAAASSSPRATGRGRKALPSEASPVSPPSSMYSRTQGFRPVQPKNLLHSQSNAPSRNSMRSDFQPEESHVEIQSTQQTRWSQFNHSNAPSSNAPSTKNPPTTPRRTKTMRALGKKVASGEYHWWDTQHSDSEDEKVVVPSLSRRDLRATANNHINNSNNDNECAIFSCSSDSEDSSYEGDEDEEEIRQRYLDEHEALLRMAHGVQASQAPRTIDYLNTLPERPADMTTVQPLKPGWRGHGQGFLRPGAPGVTDEDGRTVTRSADRSSPWL
ncbi:MAG: hypothetical protein Q9168_004591 [Polycauliona sp. 1 TL-2023]